LRTLSIVAARVEASKNLFEASLVISVKKKWNSLGVLALRDIPSFITNLKIQICTLAKYLSRNECHFSFCSEELQFKN
jgi:hypothetical protein